MRILTLQTILFFFAISLTTTGQAQVDQPDVQIMSSSNHQSENSIAIDPLNPSRIFVSTNGIAGGTVTHFISTDAGAHWSGSESTPNGAATGGDPVAFFDRNGNAFIEALGAGGTGVKLFKTTNGGSSWSGPVDSDPDVSPSDDKPHASADISGVYPNNVYVAWCYSPLNHTVREIRLDRSTTGGGSFEPSNLVRHLSDAAQYTAGPHITIGSNGEVFVCWAQVNAGNDVTENGITFLKSTDGGNGFIISSRITFAISGVNNSNNSAQAAYNGVRVNSFPSMEVDRSVGKTYSGRVYIVHADKATGEAHILLHYSSNAGGSFSTGIRVDGNPSGFRQWFPSVAVDPLSGYVFVSYYNTNTSTFLTTRWIAVSTDGGATFAQYQVSSGGFTPGPISGFATAYMGDYYETAAYGYKAYATWSSPVSGIFQAFVSGFTMPVQATLDQVYSTGGRITGSTIGRWNGTSFNPPLAPGTMVTMQGGNTETLLADRTTYSAQKHYNWNSENDVSNYHSWVIDGNTNTFTSNFNPITTGVVIQTDLIELPGTTGGNIEFKDPWYVGSTPAYLGPDGYRNLGSQSIFEPRSSPFNMDNFGGYQGVITNLLSTDPGQRYHSVQALKNQTVGIYPSVFGYWSSSSSATLATPNYSVGNYFQTSVKFTAANANITAHYKAHLMSTSSAASTSNNQRKLASFGGTTHLVYQSGWSLPPKMDSELSQYLLFFECHG